MSMQLILWGPPRSEKRKAIEWAIGLFLAFALPLVYLGPDLMSLHDDLEVQHQKDQEIMNTYARDFGETPSTPTERALSDMSLAEAVGYLLEECGHLILLVSGLAVVTAFLIWIIRTGVKRGLTSATRSVIAVRITGPGRFEVRGVDKASKLDTTWVVQAASEANARVKAEIEGIIVTEIIRID